MDVVPHSFDRRCCQWFALLLTFVVLLFLTACRPIKSLGRNPSGEALAKMEVLPNYRNGEFQNLTVFPPDSNAIPSKKPQWLRMLNYLTRKKPPYTRPSAPVPVQLTNLWQGVEGAPTVIWFGHSSFLLKSKTATLLFDPNFSGYAGPFKGLVPAFAGTQVYRVQDLPPIDALVISHDHYDHLDYATVKQLRKKVKRVIVPMGVGSHFRKWGYPDSLITEVNWNESVQLNLQVRLTATPAHHRSNRTFAQNKTLWASYVIDADGHKIFFSGDTGFSPHFAQIGRQWGPFDLALLECGQYNLKWPHSHLFPYQTARAALDLQAAAILPVHWAKFAESDHPWNEPVQRLLASCDSLRIPVRVPMIGEPYVVGDTVASGRWWEF